MIPDSLKLYIIQINFRICSPVTPPPPPHSISTRMGYLMNTSNNKKKIKKEWAESVQYCTVYLNEKFIWIACIIAGFESGGVGFESGGARFECGGAGFDEGEPDSEPDCSNPPPPPFRIQLRRSCSDYGFYLTIKEHAAEIDTTLTPVLQNIFSCWIWIFLCWTVDINNIKAWTIRDIFNYVFTADARVTENSVIDIDWAARSVDDGFFR
jgi:hypothetical protein